MLNVSFLVSEFLEYHWEEILGLMGPHWFSMEWYSCGLNLGNCAIFYFYILKYPVKYVDKEAKEFFSSICRSLCCCELWTLCETAQPVFVFMNKLSSLHLMLIFIVIFEHTRAVPCPEETKKPPRIFKIGT